MATPDNYPASINLPTTRPPRVPEDAPEPEASRTSNLNNA